VKKASEYRKHAEECRQLARREQPGERRDQLLEMAAVWDELARERADLVRNHPELALPDEAAEEASRKDEGARGRTAQDASAHV
jgi:hypothetical protein